MIEFDFVTDDQLRASLQGDYAEYRASVSGEAWKASIVLVGSMVEALLVDHLLAAPLQNKSGTDPLKMTLSQLIAACEKERILSAKTAALSTVVQGYRNLIHPGRTVRLGETANRSGAIVAGELLQMIVDELSANKRDRFGFTADEIIKKLEHDESAIAIHKHLLKDVSAPEVEKLLLKAIPTRYFQLDTTLGDSEPEPDFAAQNRLAICFRSAFGMASNQIKKKVTRHFLSIIKEEEQYKVFTYETAFFRAADLKFLAAAEAKLVKDHLLARAKEEISVELITAMDGLARFLERRDISALVDILVKAFLPKSNPPLKNAAQKYLTNLWRELPSGANGGTDVLVVRRLDDWIQHFEKNEIPESAQEIRELRDQVQDVPF